MTRVDVTDLFDIEARRRMQKEKPLFQVIPNWPSAGQAAACSLWRLGAALEIHRAMHLNTADAPLNA
jgi:hypothetical protein